MAGKSKTSCIGVVKCAIRGTLRNRESPNYFSRLLCNEPGFCQICRQVLFSISLTTGSVRFSVLAAYSVVRPSAPMVHLYMRKNKNPTGNSCPIPSRSLHILRDREQMPSLSLWHKNLRWGESISFTWYSRCPLRNCMFNTFFIQI